MFYYERPHNISKSLELNGTVLEFKTLWKNHTEKPSKETASALYNIIKPTLEKWTLMLSLPDSEKDTNFLSLMSILESKFDPTTPEEILKIYNEEVNLISDIQTEVNWCFLKVLKANKYIPKRMSDKKIIWMFAKSLKLYIKDDIVRKTRTRLKKEEQELDHQENIWYDNYPDYLYIKNSKLDNYEKYLAYLKINGYCDSEISRILRYHKEAFAIKERHLWNSLKIN